MIYGESDGVLAPMRVTSAGRGTHYHPARGLLESTLDILFLGAWPAKLWELIPSSCDVECSRVDLEALPPGSAGLRVGFISDIHLGPTTPARLVDRAFDLLASASLDLLLLGGDYVFLDATTEKAKRLVSLIERVPARQKFAVMGNHDLWTHHEILESALQRAGVQLLCNEACPVEGTSVAIVGLDEPWTGRLDAAAAMRSVKNPGTILFLCHSPDGVPAATEALEARSPMPPALYVCGHTHGGHLAAPWGPLVVPGPMGKRFPRGFYTAGPLSLYVSRGVGGTEVPVRTFARPEVVVFELSAVRASSDIA